MSWHRQAAPWLLRDTQNSPGLSQTCLEHLTPPRGTAWNNPQPCQAHDLVLQAGAKLLREEAATRVEGREAYQSKGDTWG